MNLIRVNQYRGFFPRDDLRFAEIEYLKEKKYVEHWDISIGGNELQCYLLLENKWTSESIEHLYLVKALKDFIRRYTDEVRTYQTTKPDIVFQCNGKEYAIEVETGVRITKTKKAFQRKLNNLYEKYGKRRWFFVLTSMEHLDKYQKHQTTFTKENVHRKIKAMFRNYEEREVNLFEFE